MAQDQSSSREGMTLLGWLMIFGGIVYIFIAFNMDVSVSTSSTYIPGYGSIGGGNVANLDLMARRQNHLIVAALITLVGVILAIFGHSGPRPVLPVATKAANANMHFEGERSLAADPYRLWLADTYAILRNDIFDRFVIGDQTFASLDEALKFAHDQECQKAARAAAKLAEQQRVAEERQAELQLQAELDEAEWQQKKPKVIFGTILAMVTIVGAIFAFRETPEDRVARVAQEENARIEQMNGAKSLFGVALPDDAQGIAITELAADSDYLCDGKRNGTLVKFRSKLSKEQMKEHFAMALGKGKSTYETLEGNYDWKWDKANRRYTLTMFDNRKPNEINFCMTPRDD